jgi:hypothetical protein
MSERLRIRASRNLHCKVFIKGVDKPRELLLILPRYPSIFQIKQHLTNDLLAKLGLSPWKLSWCVPKEEPRSFDSDEKLFAILKAWEMKEEERSTAHMFKVVGTIIEQLKDLEDTEQEQGALRLWEFVETQEEEFVSEEMLKLAVNLMSCTTMATTAGACIGALWHVVENMPHFRKFVLEACELSTRLLQIDVKKLDTTAGECCVDPIDVLLRLNVFYRIWPIRLSDADELERKRASKSEQPVPSALIKELLSSVAEGRTVVVLTNFLAHRDQCTEQLTHMLLPHARFIFEQLADRVMTTLTKGGSKDKVKSQQQHHHHHHLRHDHYDDHHMQHARYDSHTCGNHQVRCTMALWGWIAAQDGSVLRQLALRGSLWETVFAVCRSVLPVFAIKAFGTVQAGATFPAAAEAQVLELSTALLWLLSLTLTNTPEEDLDRKMGRRRSSKRSNSISSMSSNISTNGGFDVVTTSAVFQEHKAHLRGWLRELLQMARSSVLLRVKAANHFVTYAAAAAANFLAADATFFLELTTDLDGDGIPDDEEEVVSGAKERGTAGGKDSEPAPKAAKDDENTNKEHENTNDGGGSGRGGDNSTPNAKSKHPVNEKKREKNDVVGSLLALILDGNQPTGKARPSAQPSHSQGNSHNHSLRMCAAQMLVSAALSMEQTVDRLEKREMTIARSFVNIEGAEALPDGMTARYTILEQASLMLRRLLEAKVLVELAAGPEATKSSASASKEVGLSTRRRSLSVGRPLWASTDQTDAASAESTDDEQSDEALVHYAARAVLVLAEVQARVRAAIQKMSQDGNIDARHAAGTAGPSTDGAGAAAADGDELLVASLVLQLEQFMLLPYVETRPYLPLLRAAFILAQDEQVNRKAMLRLQLGNALIEFVVKLYERNDDAAATADISADSYMNGSLSRDMSVGMMETIECSLELLQLLTFGTMPTLFPSAPTDGEDASPATASPINPRRSIPRRSVIYIGAADSTVDPSSAVFPRRLTSSTPSARRTSSSPRWKQGAQADDGRMYERLLSKLLQVIRHSVRYITIVAPTRASKEMDVPGGADDGNVQRNEAAGGGAEGGTRDASEAQGEDFKEDEDGGSETVQVLMSRLTARLNGTERHIDFEQNAFREKKRKKETLETSPLEPLETSPLEPSPGFTVSNLEGNEEAPLLVHHCYTELVCLQTIGNMVLSKGIEVSSSEGSADVDGMNRGKRTVWNASIVAALEADIVPMLLSADHFQHSAQPLVVRLLALQLFFGLAHMPSLEFLTKSTKSGTDGRDAAVGQAYAQLHVTLQAQLPAGWWVGDNVSSASGDGDGTETTAGNRCGMKVNGRLVEVLLEILIVTTGSAQTNGREAETELAETEAGVESGAEDKNKGEKEEAEVEGQEREEWGEVRSGAANFCCLMLTRLTTLSKGWREAVASSSGGRWIRVLCRLISRLHVSVAAPTVASLSPGSTVGDAHFVSSVHGEGSIYLYPSSYAEQYAEVAEERASAPKEHRSADRRMSAKAERERERERDQEKRERKGLDAAAQRRQIMASKEQGFVVQHALHTLLNMSAVPEPLLQQRIYRTCEPVLWDIATEPDQAKGPESAGSSKAETTASRARANAMAIFCGSEIQFARCILRNLGSESTGRVRSQIYKKRLALAAMDAKVRAEAQAKADTQAQLQVELLGQRAKQGEQQVCCPAGHSMQWSGFSSGEYADGWACTDCETTADVGYRFVCTLCSEDYCKPCSESHSSNIQPRTHKKPAPANARGIAEFYSHIGVELRRPMFVQGVDAQDSELAAENTSDNAIATEAGAEMERTRLLNQRFDHNRLHQKAEARPHKGRGNNGRRGQRRSVVQAPPRQKAGGVLFQTSKACRDGGALVPVEYDERYALHAGDSDSSMQADHGGEYTKADGGLATEQPAPHFERGKMRWTPLIRGTPVVKSEDTSADTVAATATSSPSGVGPSEHSTTVKVRAGAVGRSWYFKEPSTDTSPLVALGGERKVADPFDRACSVEGQRHRHRHRLLRKPAHTKITGSESSDATDSDSPGAILFSRPRAKSKGQKVNSWTASVGKQRHERQCVGDALVASRPACVVALLGRDARVPSKAPVRVATVPTNGTSSFSSKRTQKPRTIPVVFSSTTRPSPRVKRNRQVPPKQMTWHGPSNVRPQAAHRGSLISDYSGDNALYRTWNAVRNPKKKAYDEAGAINTQTGTGSMTELARFPHVLGSKVMRGIVPRYEHRLDQAPRPPSDSARTVANQDHEDAREGPEMPQVESYYYYHRSRVSTQPLTLSPREECSCCCNVSAIKTVYRQAKQQPRSAGGTCRMGLLCTCGTGSVRSAMAWEASATTAPVTAVMPQPLVLIWQPFDRSKGQLRKFRASPSPPPRPFELCSAFNRAFGIDGCFLCKADIGGPDSSATTITPNGGSSHHEQQKMGQLPGTNVKRALQASQTSAFRRATFKPTQHTTHAAPAPAHVRKQVVPVYEPLAHNSGHHTSWRADSQSESCAEHGWIIELPSFPAPVQVPEACVPFPEAKRKASGLQLLLDTIGDEVTPSVRVVTRKEQTKRARKGGLWNLHSDSRFFRMKLAEHELVERLGTAGEEQQARKLHVDSVYYESNDAWESTFAHDWEKIDEKGGIASLLRASLSSSTGESTSLGGGGGGEWEWVEEQAKHIQEAWSGRTHRRYTHMHQSFELFAAWEGAGLQAEGGLSLMQWLKWIGQLGLVHRAREMLGIGALDAAAKVRNTAATNADGVSANADGVREEYDEHRCPSEEHLQEVFIAATGLPKFTERAELMAKEKLAREKQGERTTDEGSEEDSSTDEDSGEEGNGQEDEDPEALRRFERQMHADLCSQGVVLMQRHEALEAFTHLAMLWAIPLARPVALKIEAVEEEGGALVSTAMEAAGEEETDAKGGWKVGSTAVPTTSSATSNEFTLNGLSPKASSRPSPRSVPGSPRSVPSSPHSPRHGMAQRVSMQLLMVLTKQQSNEHKNDGLLHHNRMQSIGQEDGSANGSPGAARMVATYVDRLLAPAINATAKAATASMIASMGAGAALAALASAQTAIKSAVDTARKRAAALLEDLPDPASATDLDLVSTVSAARDDSSLVKEVGKNAPRRKDSRVRRKSNSRTRSGSIAADIENAGTPSRFALPFMCADFTANEWRRDRLYTETVDLLLHQNFPVLHAVFKRYATQLYVGHAEAGPEAASTGGGGSNSGSRPPSRASGRGAPSPTPSSSSSSSQDTQTNTIQGHSRSHPHSDDGVWGLHLGAFLQILTDCDFCSPLTFVGGTGVGNHAVPGAPMSGLITEYHARLCFFWAKHPHQHSHHRRQKYSSVGANSIGANSTSARCSSTQYLQHPRVARGSIAAVPREPPAVLYFSEFVEALALLAEVVPLPGLVHMHTACCTDVIAYFVALAAPRLQHATATPPIDQDAPAPAQKGSTASPSSPSKRARSQSRARAPSSPAKMQPPHNKRGKGKDKDKYHPLPHPAAVTRNLFYPTLLMAPEMRASATELCTVLLMKPLLAHQFDRPLHQRLALLITLVYWRLEWRLKPKKGKKTAHLVEALGDQKATMVASAHIGLICTKRANARRRYQAELQEKQADE